MCLTSHEGKSFRRNFGRMFVEFRFVIFFSDESTNSSGFRASKCLISDECKSFVTIWSDALGEYISNFGRKKQFWSLFLANVSCCNLLFRTKVWTVRTELINQNSTHLSDIWTKYREVAQQFVLFVCFGERFGRLCASFRTKKTFNSWSLFFWTKVQTRSAVK